MRHLTCAGAAQNVVDCYGNTALHLAVEADDLCCVRAIIEPVTSPEAEKVQLQYSPHPFLDHKDTADIHNYEGEFSFQLCMRFWSDRCCLVSFISFPTTVRSSLCVTVNVLFNA